MNVGDSVLIEDVDYRWTTKGFVEHKPEYVGKQGVITEIKGITITVMLEDGEELILHKSSLKLIEGSNDN